MEDFDQIEQQAEPQQNTVQTGGQSMTAQQEFDQLVARKEELWAQISSVTLYESTPQWGEIQQIDKRLLELWNDGKGSVTRKEDK